jgi:hypothetical protein
VDTIGRPVQPAVPAIPPLTQPLPKRPRRRRWLTPIAVGLALGIVATGVLAIMQSSALSAARQDVVDAEEEVQASEDRVTSLREKVAAANRNLESARESLDHARDYGNTCHAALSGYIKGIRIYYQAVRAGNRGDLETAHSLTRQAAATFRDNDLSYLKCMNEAPDEFQSV